MTRESSEEFDPYAPPLAASGLERSVTPGDPVIGDGWSVQFDLTDRDLKRFFQCDFFYEPKPILGFIPQWVLLVVLLGSGGAFFGWQRFHSLLWAGIGGLGAAALQVGFGTYASFALRQAARRAGFATGRRITINFKGVWIDYPAPAGLNPDRAVEHRQQRTKAIGTNRLLRISGFAEDHHPWESFRLVEFQRDYLILWQRGRRRQVIPVRAFESIEAAQAAAEVAAGWVESWRGRTSPW